MCANADKVPCAQTTSAKPTTTPKATTTNTALTTTKPGPFQCPDKDGMYRNPKDCASYYYCVGGVTNLLKCPDGLWFDEKIRACNFPDQVDCKVQTSTKPSGK